MADGDFDLGLDPEPMAKPALRFRPKGKGPKPAAAPVVALPPKTEAEIVVPKPDPDHGVTLAAPDDLKAGPSSPAAAPMDVDGDEEADTVVREIDVFVNSGSLGEDGKLYIIQSPLRPYWRPYEMESCQQVRLNPKQSKLEVDLRINTECENYDADAPAHLKLQKQTLSSSEAYYASNYAIGVLAGNKVHLSRVDAVVQLRPSMSHLDVSSRISKHFVVNEDEDCASAKKVKIDVNDSAQTAPESEPWISLEYHLTDSPSSVNYLHKMIESKNGSIGFNMKRSDYLASLYSGESPADVKSILDFRRELLLLPLEERLKKWFTQVSQVNRFDALMHLAPTSSEQDVLSALAKIAYLVRGLWICRSSLLPEDVDSNKRDAILLHFTKKDTITDKELVKYNMRPDLIRSIMGALCTKREDLNDWKFTEPMDSSFMKRYPEIVKKQEQDWLACELALLNTMRNLTKNQSTNTISSSKPKISVDDHGAKKTGVGGAASLASKGMSEATKRNLTEILSRIIFNDQKVRSRASIGRELKKIASKWSSSPKEKPAKALAAIEASTAPASELDPIIKQVAVAVGNVYVMKPKKQDSLSNVLILLYRKDNARKLQKQDIIKEAKLTLKRDVKDDEYNQATQEICDHTDDGYLVLKSGD